MSEIERTPEEWEAYLAELNAEMEKWDPKARAELARQLSAGDETTIQAWYCDRGRRCDGKPHDKYQWAHARGSSGRRPALTGSSGRFSPVEASARPEPGPSTPGK